MKKLLLAGLVIFAFFSLAGYTYYTKSATRVAAEYTVNLLSDRATPDALTVRVGETVQFNSRDGKSHRLAEGKGERAETMGSEDDHDHTVGGYDSGTFAADEAWRVQFKKKGTYRLHDHLNPKIYITVVVY